VAGFGIDAVAAAITAPGTLRLENLDTDLPLPPEAVAVTRAALDDPASNSWLPFTGDHGLREAISDRALERHGRRYDPEREIVITCGGTEAVLDILLATLNPRDEVVLTDPIYAGLVNRVRLAGGVPACAPLAVVDGEWRLDREALAAAVTPRTVALLLMSPSMPSGCVLDRPTGSSSPTFVSVLTCSCSMTRPWRRCCSTAASSSRRCRSTGWPSAR
jgi:aspartate/methionine/tyrosine aminotransferase